MNPTRLRVLAWAGAVGVLSLLGRAETSVPQGRLLFEVAGEQPEEGWRVNLWGKHPDGRQGAARITAVPGPDGGKALQLTAEDVAGCSFISPAPADGPWRDSRYGGVEVTYRGDGSPGSASLFLVGAAADGKAAPRISYGLPLYEQAWRTVVLTQGWRRPGEPKLDLAQTRQVYVGAAGTLTVALARVRLLTEDGVRALEAAKPAEQRAWEAGIKPNLRRLPGFAYVKDDPALPRVLIIGDSISIHYTHFVRRLLRGKANVHRIPTNGGPTKRGLESLDKWLGNGKWDVIFCNWGLHDSKYEKWDRKSGKRYSTPEQYAANLGKLVARLKTTGARLIWATTTPVPEGAKTHDVGDSVRFNAVATPLMEKHGIAVSDLYSLVKPDLAAHQKPKNIHFSPEGSAFLARKVADDILTALATATK